MQEVSYSGHVPHLIDEHVYRPVDARRARGGRLHARRLQSGRLGTYVAYLIGLVVVLLAAARIGADRMSAATVAAARAQVVGGVAARAAAARPRPALEGAAAGPPRADAAPALPRAAPALGQEHASTSRERRSSTGSRRPSSPRALGAAVLLVPAAAARARTGASATTRSRSPGCSRWRASRVAAAAWDVAQRLLADGREPRPHALRVRRGDARALARRRRARRRARPTCAASSRARPATDVWSSPALALGGVAFALVVVAETGRQPVDNPDTHLELTMIHEGPLLEYAGRDLAYLQWAAAARHWLVLVLAAQVFLPHADERLVAARAPARRARRPLRGARAHRDARREDARSCSSRGCSAAGAVVALLGIVAWLVEAA